MSGTISSNSGFFKWVREQMSEHAITHKRRASIATERAVKNSKEFLKRKELVTLLERPDEQLSDIGICREDLQAALQLPLSESAASWLKQCARR